MEQKLSPDSKLCLACGMCCDATLHGFARLLDEDVEPARAVGFPTFTTPNGLPAMPQPCHCLNGTACSRYESWRPSVCSGYFCKLQKRFRSGDCTFEDAMGIIASALKARAAVEELMPAGGTLRDARVRFDELASSKQALAPTDARLVVQVFALERFLDLNFRKANATALPKEASAPPSDKQPMSGSMPKDRTLP